MEIFLSAGEASGDLHGANLAHALRKLAPQVKLSCLGGPLMKAAGVGVVVDNRKISVVGVSEVLAQSKSIYAAWVKMKSYLLATRPSVVVLIDFPDFNFLLGSFAKKIGAKVFFYISPQIWGWRKWRVKKIGRLMDGMAVILPFEKDFYASYGIDVDYVGHPLSDPLRSVADKPSCNSLYHGFEGPLVGLLPGSRRKEIAQFFPMLMAAEQIILKALPQARFIMPVAPSVNAWEVEQRAAQGSMPLQVVRNDTYRALRACDLIITKTGTVTLEAAILQTPMIAFYKVSRVTRLIVKPLLTVDFIALPNLIAGREIVPEFVRKEPSGPVLAEAALRLLKSPRLLEAQRAELRQIRDRLDCSDISEKVARLVLDRI